VLPIALMLMAVPISSTDAAKAAVANQAEAWNRGDLAAFTSVYADDAVFISPSGLTKGRKAVLERYTKRYPDKKAMGTLSLEFLDARELKDGVSLVAKWTLAYPDKPAASGHTLLVVQLKGDKWFIVQDASM
jgi:uncharacterized protein (TIGR02246 family)